MNQGVCNYHRSVSGRSPIVKSPVCVSGSDNMLWLQVVWGYLAWCGTFLYFVYVYKCFPSDGLAIRQYHKIIRLSAGP